MNDLKLRIYLFFCIVLFNFNALAQSDNIRLNQLGYFPSAVKYASVVTTVSGVSFYIKSDDLERTYFTGELGTPTYWDQSGETYSMVDFSSFNVPGTYRIEIPSLKLSSHPFRINDGAFLEAIRTTLKSFYFARCSYPILPEYGGVWARESGHLPDSSLIHGSAATILLPEGTMVAGKGGWYDAGDYNKYVVPSAFSNYFLLLAYELYPELFNVLKTNIPESTNNVPDILDECLWNLRWMMTMQDPNDGGVYHKQTSAKFESLHIMPKNAKRTRYMVQKSTPATYSLAAILAQASRIYAPYYPEFADSCLLASKKAFEWALTNPHIYYDNNAVNYFSPAIRTGEYNDDDEKDEKNWAAAELYITTSDDSFYGYINWTGGYYGYPSWSKKYQFAAWSLRLHRQNLTAIADIALIKSKANKTKDKIKSSYDNSALKTPQVSEWWWGSNSIAATKGLVCLLAHKMSNGLTEGLDVGLGSADYLLGRNATAYSFVTGLGGKSPMHPHHRVSIADGIEVPVPGMLVGGPNSSGSFPAKEYADTQDNYFENEVAINYTAPLLLVLAGLQDHYLSDEYTQLSVTDVPMSPAPLSVLQQTDNSIKLEWTDNSSTELGFIIEKSVGNQVDFFILDIIPSDETIYYDNDLISGAIYYYRLMAYNVVGNSSPAEASNGTVGLDLNDTIAKPMITFPNPSQDQLTVSIANYSTPLNFDIIDLNGKTLKHGTLNSNKIIINITKLASGIYLLIINDGIKMYGTYKFIKNQ